MSDLSGQTIRGYELRRPIGDGGFGSMYLVRKAGKRENNTQTNFVVGGGDPGSTYRRATKHRQPATESGASPG